MELNTKIKEFWKDDVTVIKAVIILSCFTLLSVCIHLIAFQGAHRIPSDTNSFLELVALIKGTPLMSEHVPYRIQNPFYGFMIFLSQIFTKDWVTGARIAALIPSFLTPPLLCIIAWVITGHFLPGCFAGLIGALNWPLLLLGVTPLSDSTFIFFSAISLWSGLMLLRRNKIRWAFIAGLAAGCAWSTRAPGLFYLLAVSIPMLLNIGRQFYGKCKVKFSNLFIGERSLLPCLIFIFTFGLFGLSPTMILQTYSTGLKPPLNYNKIAFLNGAYQTYGTQVRDKLAYSLNKDCTNFAHWEEAEKTWGQLLRNYWKSRIQVFLKNMKENFEKMIPMSMRPFILVFLPLSVGTIIMWKHVPLLEILVLCLFALPYILIIPAFQLHFRYIYPINIVTIPLIGIGLSHMLFHCKHTSILRMYLERTLVIAILFLLSFFVFYGVYVNFKSYDNNLPYRQASMWIDKKHSGDNSIVVMSHYHSVYAYLKRPKTALPVDSLDRLVRYARNTNTKYILIGPKESILNPHLFVLLKEPEAFKDVGNTRLKIVAQFGIESSQKVIVVEIEKISG